MDANKDQPERPYLFVRILGVIWWGWQIIVGIFLVLGLVAWLCQSCDKHRQARRRSRPPEMLRETIGEQAFEFFDNGNGATLVHISNATGRVAIPGILGNRAVTKLDGHGLLMMEQLQSVEIPGSVIDIGTACFAFSGIIDAAIPGSVRNIGRAAFSSCDDLESVRFCEGLTNIGASAFSKCSHLQTIVLPSTLGSIGDSAFSECIRLKSLVVPSGVREIGSMAFSYCEDLESVALPDGLLNIGDFAFAGCRRLKHVDIPNSVTNVGRFAFDPTLRPPPDYDD